MQWIKSKGRIIYDPHRPGLKSRNQWWCILEVDEEITRYYRWFINRHVRNPLGLPKQDLCMPAWGAHMSILRGEKPKPHLSHLWRKYHGQTVEFEYQHNPRQTGVKDTTRPDWYWFIDARCDIGKHIRDELTLPSHWNFHITVGRTYPN